MRRWWLATALVFAVACSDDDASGPGGPLDAPASLTSTSLDGGVALVWSDNPFQSDPDLFRLYRVYSTSYNLDINECGADWSVEGTTVSPEFLVGSLANGVPKCFAVTAEGVDGGESNFSPIRSDTPRPDARNVALSIREVTLASSGFRFWNDDGDGTVESSELGVVLPGNSPAADFAVVRDVVNGPVFLQPLRDGTSVADYGPVADLTSVDIAPETGFSIAGIEARPGQGYVFEMSGGDEFARYGAIRVSHVGPTLIILDWAFQTDPGNPELMVGRK